MKTRIFMAAGLAAILGLASCTNENNPEQGRGTKGEDTYASFKVSVSSNGTRADGEDEGLAEEQTIAQMQLYIFSEGILEAHETVTLNESGKTSPVKISTGEKIIYAIASPATAGNASYLTTGDSDTEIEAVVETTKLADFQAQLFNALNTQIASPEEFVMIGRSDKVAIVKCKEAEAETKNLVKIDIDRATAKALVKYVSEGEDAVKVRETINATFSDPKFLIAQAAEEMVMTPYNQLSQIAEGVYTPGTKIDGVGTYSGYTAMPDVTTATFKDACTDWSSATTCDEFEYFAENRTAAPVTGNTTFALIRLKATPNVIYSGAKANATTGKVDLTTGSINGNGDFWTVVKHDAVTGSLVYATDANYNILYFTSDRAAKDYIKAAKLPADYASYQFTGGLVYYRVNLITDKDSEDLSLKYRVDRNSYYQINVTDIKALGAHDGGDVVPTDPDQPLDPEGWLVVQITVKKWTVVDMGGTVLQ